MKKTNNKGFSLVELIIVIAIMAVLIGVLAPQFIQYVAKSRVSTDLQNVEEMVTATDTYAADHDNWTQAGKITVSATGIELDADVAAAYNIKSTYTFKATWNSPSITYTAASGWVRTGSADVKGGYYTLDGAFTSAAN